MQGKRKIILGVDDVRVHSFTSRRRQNSTFPIKLICIRVLMNTLGFHFRLSMTASCPMLLHNYPLDKQVCRLAFESCKSNCFTIFTMSKAGYIFFGSTGRLEDSGLCGLLTRWSKAVGENMKNEKS